VTDYSAEEVARRAGVEPGYMKRILESGMLATGEDESLSPADVPKVRLIETLERSGVSFEGIATAIRKGSISMDFMEGPFYERFGRLSQVTFRQEAERAGVPVELLMVVREAIGYGQPDPEDRMREDELQITHAVERMVATGSRPAVVERLLRVYGESMRRVGEMEGHWWHTEVEMPLFASGMSEAEMLRESHRLSAELATVQEQALIAIYHAQQEHAATKNIMEDIESALAKEGVHSRVDRAPGICFLDITGYTRLTEERGDEAAADLAGRLSRVMQRTSMQHGGKPVKWLGDGVMFYFRDPGPGVVAALEMVDGAAEAGLPPAHVGLHAGPVLFQEGDYFGRTVNVAARIADYARPGEVLVTQDVVDASEDVPVSFTEIGPIELKGVAGPVVLHSARRRR
jgi:adenylate cyclase